MEQQTNESRTLHSTVASISGGELEGGGGFAIDLSVSFYLALIRDWPFPLSLSNDINIWRRIWPDKIF